MVYVKSVPFPSGQGVDSGCAYPLDMVQSGTFLYYLYKIKTEVGGV